MSVCELCRQIVVERNHNPSSGSTRYFSLSNILYWTLAKMWKGGCKNCWFHLL